MADMAKLHKTTQRFSSGQKMVVISSWTNARHIDRYSSPYQIGSVTVHLRNCPCWQQTGMNVS